MAVKTGGRVAKVIGISSVGNDTKARPWPASVGLALDRVGEQIVALDRINDDRYPDTTLLPGEREVDRIRALLRKLTDRWDAGEDVATELEAAVLDWGDLCEWVVKTHRSRPRLRSESKRPPRGWPAR
jgi:hypothetical protein